MEPRYVDLDSNMRPVGNVALDFRADADHLADMIQDQDLQKLEQFGGAEGLIQSLVTDVDDGLSQGEVLDNFSRRRAIYGANVYPKKASKSLLSMIWDALQDRMLQILIVAAIISIFLGVFAGHDEAGWIEGVAILLAVFLVVSVSAGNDYSKEQKFRKLSEVRDDKKIRVRRAGLETVISVKEINVGEIVLLESGDSIPADGIFIRGFDLTSDEAPLTGESELVRKNEDRPWLFANCRIMTGTGSMICLAVGPRSQWGRIKALLDTEQEPTPLETKLEDLADNIGKLGVCAAALTFVALTIQWAVQIVRSEEAWNWEQLADLVDFIIIAVTIIVVAVPEGLPLAVTLSLAYSMIKMMKDNNLVRHLSACETMGGATNICSDKTGTLTENRMTVIEGWVANKQFAIDRGTVSFINDIASLLAEAISVNSTASVVINSQGQREYTGSKTECALLDFCSNILHINWDETRKRSRVEKAFPFSSVTKQMASVIASNSRYRLHSKGAPEIVLAACNYVIDENGHRVELTDALRRTLEGLITDLASKGLRTLCLTYTDTRESLENIREIPNREMTCLAIFGIKDPLRAEVPAAVEQCKRAGIIVRMVTGDNVLTACHIARECGILTADGIYIEGPKFRRLSTDELDRILPRLQVIARASPEDKLMLVRRLKTLGEVVASTGDGTNDAPQLREADVGFAMGIAGTEVAKDASDIILMDDNFSSIVKAVMWGRNVYDSIRKFLQFQLTVNVCAVVIAFVGAVSKGESPLSAVQMLWVNLIMDTMAALALATEEPTPALLERPPYGRFDSLINNAMWRTVIGQSIYQMIVLFTLLYGIQNFEFAFGVIDPTNHDLKNSIIFNTFVMCQIFNEINCRKLGNDLNIFAGFFTNWIFILVLIVTVVVQFLIVEFGGKWASTVPLNLQQWISCVVIGFVSMPFGFLLKFIPIPNDKPGERLFDPESGDGLTEEQANYSSTSGSSGVPHVTASVSSSSAQTALIQTKSKWAIARRVLAEIRVIQAFRRHRRAQMIY
eukprot:TRINITY_DN2167_c0_g1_i7.p1 TRINITY_DN2167_c0_g1~~TRINITY_DN2167_c0_g1_i7.p1  ORF type:complete len:1023 (+),score=555.41 TRINITY_DN2167_c0_g1_i7:262-3330(+)